MPWRRCPAAPLHVTRRTERDPWRRGADPVLPESCEAPGGHVSTKSPARHRSRLPPAPPAPKRSSARHCASPALSTPTPTPRQEAKITRRLIAMPPHPPTPGELCLPNSPEDLRVEGAGKGGGGEGWEGEEGPGRGEERGAAPGPSPGLRLCCQQRSSLEEMKSEALNLEVKPLHGLLCLRRSTA